MHPYLRNVRYDCGLKLFGSFVHNYYELANELKFMKDSDFIQLLTKNPIPNWILTNFGDKELVHRLKAVYERIKYIQIMERRIQDLEKARGAPAKPIALMSPWPWVGVILVLISLIVAQHLYFADLETSNDNTIFSLEEGLAEASRQKDLLEQLLLLERQERAALAEIIPDEDHEGPRDRIKEEDIAINDTTVVLSISGASFSRIADTSSMLPTITSGSNPLEIVPESPTLIRVGDILSYELNSTIYIHRVVEIGEDSTGWYAYLKGDNSPGRDPEKVRFSQVQRLVIGILY